MKPFDPFAGSVFRGNRFEVPEGAALREAINPADLEAAGRIALAGKELCEDLAREALAAQKSWKKVDAKTRAAVALLGELLAATEGPVIRCRLAPGQGIISNNVLHNRSAFQDDSMERRLVYRMRFLDRIVATEAQAAT